MRRTALHVLLVGPHAGRVARLAEREGIAPAEADRRVRAHDRARKDYMRRVFGVEADDRTLYHLIVDTVAWGTDASVELVLAASRARTLFRFGAWRGDQAATAECHRVPGSWAGGPAARP
jgi:cytidylate kinase